MDHKKTMEHSERDGNTRPPDLPPEKPVCMSRSNRTRHGTTDWFQIGKGVCQGCILSPCLFNLYAEYIIRNARLDEAQARIKTACDGEVSEPLVGRQGSRVSMRVARGISSLLSSPGRGTWPRDVLKKVSRGLSRVEAGNPGFPRLVQVTSGGFTWWL